MDGHEEAPIVVQRAGGRFEVGAHELEEELMATKTITSRRQGRRRVGCEGAEAGEEEAEEVVGNQAGMPFSRRLDWMLASLGVAARKTARRRLQSGHGGGPRRRSPGTEGANEERRRSQHRFH